MKRDIRTLTPKATSRAIPMDTFEEDPIKWLSKTMEDHQLRYLLAHADDGVIWGRLDGQELITSHDVAPRYSPPLRVETLQMARIFGPDNEVLVYRDEVGAWVGRLITETGTTPDDTAEWSQAFDEQQILWGTKAEPRAQGFTLMSDGSQGFFHAVPLTLRGHFDEQTRPLRLVVRHYLKADENGFIRVHASRLVNLLSEPKESKS